MARQSRRPTRRPARNAAELMLIGPALMILAAFPLFLAFVALRDFPTHSNPADLAAMGAAVGIIGLGAFVLGAYCLTVAIRGEAR